MASCKLKVQALAMALASLCAPGKGNAQNKASEGSDTTASKHKYSVSVGIDSYHMSHSFRTGTNSIVTWRDCNMIGGTVGVSKRSDDGGISGLSLGFAKSVSGYSTDDDAMLTKAIRGMASFHNTRILAASLRMYKKKSKPSSITKAVEISYKRFDNIDAMFITMMEGIAVSPIYIYDDPKSHQLYHLAHIKRQYQFDLNLYDNNASKINLSAFGGPSLYMGLENWRGRDMKGAILGFELSAGMELNCELGLGGNAALVARVYVGTDQGFYSGAGLLSEKVDDSVVWDGRRRTETNIFGFSLAFKLR